MSGWWSLSTKKGGWGSGWLNGFSPLSWFAAGEQGAWYDPSDLTTLFQNSAGTTPVTAVEQPVGLMLDKSGRNNHAFQATAGNRPVLSARVNLLTKTEDFSDAVWSKRGTCTATANAGIAPNGTNTASLIAGLGPVGSGDFYNAAYASISSTAGTIFSPSYYIKRVSTVGTLTISNPSNDVYGKWNINLALLSDGWERITNAHPAVTVINIFVIPPTGVGCGILGSTTTGPLSFYIWGADLRPTNSGALLPPYQRVNTASDYNTVGFPLYLKCNGTSSAMSTNSIDFSSTDKMTVVTGVRKLSDAAIGTTLELSATSASNNGSFTLTAPNSAAANYAWLSKGTTADTLIATTYAAPLNNVLTGLGNISGATNSIRVNGIATSDTNSQGTGNFGNYPLYLFARSGTSLFLNGQFYGAIIRGAASDTASVTQTENYMATKTGITF